MKISFIGFGKIAKALAKGLLLDEKNTVRAASPSLPLGINAQGIETNPDNLAVIANADIIILAVKPAIMETVFTQISPKIPAHSLVISVATGKSLNWFATRSPSTAVVRAMPNVAASIGKSATPLIANRLVTAEQKNWAEHIFTRVGLVTWAKNDRDIDAFTALSGSGPAYIFMFMEAMIKAGIELGISEDVAKSFALQTFNGALSLATETPLSLTELRQMVTSPAGTTAAAIEVLTQNGFDELIHQTMLAAFNRACELGLS